MIVGSRGGQNKWPLTSGRKYDLQINFLPFRIMLNTLRRNNKN